MARVKVCPTCGRKNPAVELSCPCNYPLGDVPVTDDTPLGKDAEPAPKKGSDEVVSEVRDAPELPGTIFEDAARATLVFEWGEIAVSGRDSVRIGRDPEFSPHAEQIADNEYVSRRHAEVFMENDYLYVRHMSTTNPTYRNEVRITKAGEMVQLFDKDKVGFSRHLTATVRLG